MNSTKVRFIFSFFIMGFILTACFKKEEYPVVPVITYESFIIAGDTAVLTFNFTDGDGDLGLSESDTLAPYNTESEYYYNLYLNYYEKTDDNGWEIGKDLEGDSIQFKYRMKPIEYSGKTKGLKGQMAVNMGSLFYNNLSTESDTIKYSIQLIDKALNKSNIIETEEIIR